MNNQVNDTGSSEPLVLKKLKIRSNNVSYRRGHLS